MTNSNKKIKPLKTEWCAPLCTYFTFANQKRVKVKKPKFRKQFTSVETEYMWIAMHRLKGEAFKLYMYLASNANNWEFGLAPSNVCPKTGMSETTYRSAVKKLIEEGFLHEYREGTNFYYFTMEPTLRGGMTLNEYDEWCDATHKKDYQWTEEDNAFFCGDDMPVYEEHYQMFGS